MFAASLKRTRDDDIEIFNATDSKKLCPLRQPIVESGVQSTADHHQSLRFRAPALTPNDSSEDEVDDAPGRGHRPPILHLGADISTAKHLRPVVASGDNLSPCLNHSQPGSLQPSPIPHQLVNQSLTINGIPATTPTHGYFPPQASPLAVVDQPDLYDSGDVAMHSGTHPPAAIRMPSPVSDNGDAVMGTPENTGDGDAEMNDCSPPSFTPSVPRASANSAGIHRQVEPTVVESQHLPTCTTAPRRRSPLVMGYRADCNKCLCRVPGHYSHIRRS